MSRPTHRPDPFLTRLADAFRPLDDFGAIQAVAARMLGEQLGAARALYGEIAEDGATVLVCADHVSGDGANRPRQFRLDDFGPLAAETLGAGLTLVRKDGIPQITVPQLRDGRLRSLLSVREKASRSWTEDEVALVEEAAEQTWAALARAQADEAARESEAKYRSLFNSIDEGFCVIQILLDREGNPRDYRFLEANRVFERQTGLAGAVGRTARELVPNLESHWFEIYGRVALTGEPIRFEQGSEAMGRWFDVYAFRVGRPELLRVAVLFSDITQRRRAEAERDDLAAQRQLALNAARLGWWHYDPVRRTAWWDERYKEIFGITADQDPIEISVGRIHPEDRPSVWAAVEAALDPEDSVPYSVQYRINRPDGQIRWVEAHGLATFEEVDGARRATAFLGTVADITERKAAEQALRESEQRFRSMADTAPAVLWVTEPDGYCTFLSRGWYEMTGQSEAEALGFGWSEAVHPDDRGPSRDAFLAANERREPFALDYRLRQADGTYRWAVDAGRPRFGPEGEFLGFIGSVIDIHDRKQAEEQLRQASKMEAIGRLAGGIAHDFNNQLHAVSGFASLVARDPGLGARARQDLEDIRRATERMAGLTRQLLAFSRQQVLQPETLQLNEAVMEGSSLLRRLIGSNIEMKIDLTPEPTWVRVDPAQLLQVLMNLAINARDAMPEGGRLEIRTRRHEVSGPGPRDWGRRQVEPGSYVLLSVRDDGTGIPHEDLPHIFEPFFTTKSVGKGTGLGLATVHGVVAQSRGYVWAESDVRGTTFTVLLPAVGRPSGPHRLRTGEAAPVTRAARILVVDDEDVVRDVIGRTLADEGYEVVQARDGADALRMLGGGVEVDLVLSDVVMPGLGSRELRERLAAAHPDLPLVWMSGYPRDSVLDDPVASSGSAFLQKPIPSEVLIRTVQGALARRVVRS